MDSILCVASVHALVYKHRQDDVDISPGASVDHFFEITQPKKFIIIYIALNEGIGWVLIQAPL